MSFSPKPYAPWNSDINKARAMLVLGIFWLAAGCWWSRQNPAPAAIGFTFLSVPFIYAGLHIMERGKKRKHGSEVEKAAAKKFIRQAPKNWMIKEGLYLGKSGDVDLIVSLPSGERCTIEIKSWHRAGFSTRTAKAVFQAIRQREEMRSRHGILWFPESGENKTSRRFKNILVIEGDESLLLKELHRLGDKSYTVQFPAPPEEGLRESLKKLGFRWNKQRARWEGKATGESMEKLSKEIEKAKGKTTLVS